MSTDEEYIRMLWAKCKDEVEALKAENRVLKNKIMRIKQVRKE